MPRMLDLIRNSEVPANLMHSAAHGSLALLPGETLEVLVYLAVHHKVFGEQARLTLAGWDEDASRAAAADPTTSGEVLGYLASLDNLRPSLLPALLENPSVSEHSLDALAMSGSRSVVETMLASARVMSSRRALQALQSNPNLHPSELADISKKLAVWETDSAEELAADAATDAAAEEAVSIYLETNAAELAKEPEKPFEPVRIAHEEVGSAKTAATPQSSAANTMPGVRREEKGSSAVAVAAHAKKHPHPVSEERRDSALQKIAKLDIKGRIALAMRGSKEERSILIRDATKLVALAVLDSPKVSELEVEGFARQKNVLEAVLRTIPMRRKFVKNYSIVRNLVFNPRSPIDLSLTLIKNLLVHDLRNLSGNKEVSDTVRKQALRLFRQKTEKKD